MRRLGKASIRSKGEKIEVKLFDTSYSPFFKQKANLNNRKEMKQLMDDLKDKGVNLMDFL